MLPRVAYLSWAIETFPHAKWDLATSGLPSITAAELGVPGTLSDPGASQAFAAKIAARYGVPEAEVVPALGTSGAVWMLAAAVLPGREIGQSQPREVGQSQPRGEGCEVLIEEPTYEPLLRVIEGLGAKVRRVRREAEDGYRLDAKRVAAALTDATRLVVVASPHNPTGLVTPDEDLAEMAAACAARGAYLLVDEVYREFVAPGTSARRLGANVLTASSLTKCFGVGWARAGWALMPADLAEAARTAERHAAGVLPTMCGAIGEHALGRIGALEARAQAIGAGKREVVDAFMARQPRLAWTPPPARALFGFVRTSGIDVDAALARALREHGLAVVPGSYFGEPDGFRLSWASLPPDRLAAALELLESALGCRA